MEMIKILQDYLDSSLQGVKRLFLFAFYNTDNGVNKVERNSHRKSRADITNSRVDITNYNLLIHG